MRAALLVILLSLPVAAEGLREDHARHAVVGLSVGALVYAVTPMFLPGAPEWAPWALGATAGIALGLLKEGADLLGFGTPSLDDALWTLGGACAGAMLGHLLVVMLPRLTAGDVRGALGLSLVGRF